MNKTALYAVICVVIIVVSAVVATSYYLPSSSPSSSPSPAPTTANPTANPTTTPQQTITPSSSPTESALPSATPTSSLNPTNSPSPTASLSPSTPASTPTVTATPTVAPTPTPTVAPTPSPTPLPATQQITDMAGRTVTVTNHVTKVIGLNYGALRLITYMQESALVCGVEQTELTNTGRTYAMAHPEYQNITVIGPQFGGDPELIAAAHPDVVFITDQTTDALNSLQSQIGVPVIGITYGGIDTTESLQTFYDSLTLMGKVFHNEDRATAVINYVQDIITDLNTRTSSIADANKPTVYIAGLSSRGTHGFTSTSASYAPFTLTGSKNVITLAMANNSTQIVNVDVEALPSLNPNIIFVDYAGYTQSLTDVQNHLDVYNQLSAIQNGKTYGVMSYNNYALNFDVALADTYYVGSVLYPNQFSGINPQEKADEIFTFLCGAPLYNQMVANYGPFAPVDLTP